MKDGVKARYTLEFKREAVRLVHGGEKISTAGGIDAGLGIWQTGHSGRSDIGRTSNGSHAKSDG